MTNVSVVTRPLFRATAPGWRPFNSSGSALCLGKMREGGTLSPPALKLHTTVTFSPLSLDTIFATRLVPVGDNTFGSFVGRVNNPDSHTLSIWCAVKSFSGRTSLRL